MRREMCVRRIAREEGNVCEKGSVDEEGSVCEKRRVCGESV